MLCPPPLNVCSPPPALGTALDTPMPVSMSSNSSAFIDRRFDVARSFNWSRIPAGNRRMNCSFVLLGVGDGMLMNFLKVGVDQTSILSMCDHRNYIPLKDRISLVSSCQ